MATDWIGFVEVRRNGPLPVRKTAYAQTEMVEMQNGNKGEFCIECGKLAICPQCFGDLRGKTKCHVTMATHYRDNDCKYNGNFMHDYARKANK